MKCTPGPVLSKAGRDGPGASYHPRVPRLAGGLVVAGLGPPKGMNFPHCTHSLLPSMSGCKTCARGGSAAFPGRQCTWWSEGQGDGDGTEDSEESPFCHVKSVLLTCSSLSSPLPSCFGISTSVQNFRHLGLPGDSIIFALKMLIEFDKR